MRRHDVQPHIVYPWPPEAGGDQADVLAPLVGEQPRHLLTEAHGFQVVLERPAGREGGRLVGEPGLDLVEATRAQPFRGCLGGLEPEVTAPTVADTGDHLQDVADVPRPAALRHQPPTRPGA